MAADLYGDYVEVFKFHSTVDTDARGLLVLFNEVEGFIRAEAERFDREWRAVDFRKDDVGFYVRLEEV